MKIRKLRKPWPDRFWDKVEKSGACWVWTASKDSGGYGHIRDPYGRLRRATHIAWELIHGSPVPESTLVCHHCDNPACVRVSHLFLGDHGANARDMTAKQRQYRVPDHQRLRGEEHPRAKLTANQVREIRQRSANGESQRKLASAFGVGKHAIQGIIEGRYWRHIL